ncbi:glycogen synthase GlgA [Tautonia sociabilis]|uniref:Glycogen synthase n=1 Tax=Tautonia sociabilis TaxID=2080755 RepID=A0A432MIX9_9BACT|nr:glycogen synthase GlgA [Tautonia sociabilis]RUL87322.1 glycogen synthase GlgA [Tautonia sociabilis]
MKVLLLSAEVDPFAKTGGLADVAAALPRALRDLGHEVAVILPAYRRALAAGPEIRDTGAIVRAPIARRSVEGRILASALPPGDVPVYLIDRPSYFDRRGLYGEDGQDYPDNCERFVFFQRAALEAIRVLGLSPDVIHCNDWQTGLVPVYLEEVYRRQPGSPFRAVGTVMTIHNLAYQGAFWHLDLPLTGLDWSLFNPARLEAHGLLNFLKAGLVYADVLSTVSPTYAREIQTPEGGRGLDGLLRARRGRLHGIVNGIDPTAWNPAIDPHLAARYTVRTWPAGKQANKAQLQAEAGLDPRPELPLLAAIGRLDVQKGWDLIIEGAEALLSRNLQLVVLGTGDPRFERALDRLAAAHPGQLRAFLEFSQPRAHRIEAGADLFLMPSLYEPCGLNQLYSLAYGTVPLVRATGGLADTVVDATPEALRDGSATGFSFVEPSAEALIAAVDRALALWRCRDSWARLVDSGMRADWTWHRSARAYVELYDEAQRLRSSRSAG